MEQHTKKAGTSQYPPSKLFKYPGPGRDPQSEFGLANDLIVGEKEANFVFGGRRTV